jgi:hypothetical protein
MSRENVALVRSLFPPPDTNFVVLFRDDAAWETARRELGRFFDEDVESAIVMPGEGSGETKTHRGFDGFRQTWLDWLQPLASKSSSLPAIEGGGETWMQRSSRRSPPSGPCGKGTS